MENKLKVFTSAACYSIISLSRDRITGFVDLAGEVATASEEISSIAHCFHNRSASA